MNRIAPTAAVAILAGFIACQREPAGDPAPCLPIAAQTTDPGLPSDTVWGFVDLHAHPAIERAFGGRLIWGSAIDDAPVNASQLPIIDSCPVETHDRDAASPIERAVGGVVFPAVSNVAHFAHAPVGNLSFRPSDAWPNARDVIHQQMNVASIRRAYEGGLRLMFASTTDDQVISALLLGPNFINGFVPQAESDFQSAKAQIEFIQRIVEANANWMWVARTPAEARRIIQSGRLAIVLSLEMNGLSQPDLDSLVDDFGVRHIVPIHLIDNDVGGTAANSDLFNAASATVSELYRSDRKPMGYMDVAATAAHPRSLDWPMELGTSPGGPFYVGLQSIPYPWYAQDLCYEPLSACSGAVAAPTSFIEFGQQNFRGLCSTATDCALSPRPGVARIRHMMDRQLFVDVSHMSDRSVSDTLGVTPSAPAGPNGYPLIASHGDIAHLCDEPSADPACVDTSPGLVSERSLDADSARTIVGREGVLGLGSGVGTYNARTVIEARGGPLLTLNSATGPTAGCVAKPASPGVPTAGCESVPNVEIADPAAAVQTLQVQTVGGISGTGPNAAPFVRIELGAPDAPQYQHHVLISPLQCGTQGCSGSVDLGSRDNAVAPASGCTPLTCAGSTCGSAPYTLDDIQSVTVEWLYLACDLACQEASNSNGVDRQCQSTWDDDNAPSWTVDEASVVALSPDHTSTPLVAIGPRASAPILNLGRNRGTFTLYQRGDRAAANKAVPASGNLLRVSLQSGTEQTLQGATTEQGGANVCVAVRSSATGTCAPTPPPEAGATECPDGWVKLNQRGTWASGTMLYAFARFPGPESTICGVDVAVLDWVGPNPAWTIDEIKVEAIEDPVGHWIRRYADIAKYVAGGQLGTVGFGTDFNGLNGLTDISEFPVPAGALAASACVVTGGGDDDGGIPAQPLAPMRLRNQDGSLGAQVRIDERGLATYGLLADLMAIIGAYPGCGTDVHDSLMLSAEATLRTWEAIVDPTAPPRPPLPVRPFACGPVPGLGP